MSTSSSHCNGPLTTSMAGLPGSSVDGTLRHDKLIDNGSVGHPGFHSPGGGQRPTVHSYSQRSALLLAPPTGTRWI